MAFCASAALYATTVIAPTFQQLISQADVVFEGEVIDTKSRISTDHDNQTIVTDVYFRVAKVLKGDSPTVTILEFLGGEVGDRGYKVDGVPTFVKGDRDVIFAITSQRQASPLVGMMHGRIRIATDRATSQDLVRRFDGTPLRETQALGESDRQAVLSQKPSMSLSAFESAVVAEVAKQRAQKERK
jgi:hypothetical protein